MKRILVPLLAILAFAGLAFGQTGPVTRTIPLNYPYGPLTSGRGDCTPPGFLDSYTSGQVTYNFPSGAPNAVTLTLTGSTNGRTFSTIDTGTTTTGGAIAWSSEYTAVCITATTMTGSGVTVQGVFQGIPTIGSVTVDPTGLATSAKQDTQQTSLTAIAAVDGTTTDAAATQGSTGTISAKLRTITAQLNTLYGLAATDPCAGVATTGVDLHLASTTVTRVISASASNKNYICSMDIVVGGTAEIVSLVEGTGANCTSPAVLWGSATAASGFAFGANGGIARSRTISGKSTNIATCVQTSGSNAITVHIEYVQAP